MRAFLMTVLLFAWVAPLAVAQQSDYEITRSFEEQYAAIRTKLDEAVNTDQLDAMKKQIDALEIDFREHAELLDRALYPETFAERISALRNMHSIAYNRTSLIQSQGGRITELETQMTALTVHLDSLNVERDRLFSELDESRKSVSALRDAVRRLTTNLQAHERLVFSMVDSIFLPYGHDLTQASDVQKEAVENKLERANIVTRVYDIASDNVRFLEATQLQGKDYVNMIDQFQQFRSRWTGLRGNISAVVEASEKRGGQQAKGGKGTKSAAAAAQVKSAQVDSLLTQWNRRLQGTFWSGIEKEFTNKGVTLAPFSDGPGFSASIRAYVASLKESGQDASVFVDEVWKGRIDKDWRDALSRENMLGKNEYSALDRLVSELDQKKIDLKLILYIVGVLAIVALGWWLLARRPKQRIEEPPATMP